MVEENDSRPEIRRRPKQWERKIIQWSVILCSLIIITLSLIGDKGLLQLIALKQREARLEQEIEALRQEREEWIHKIESLKNKQSYVETIAREELGMVKNYEFVYQFEFEFAEVD